MNFDTPYPIIIPDKILVRIIRVPISTSLFSCWFPARGAIFSSALCEDAERGAVEAEGFPQVILDIADV